MASYDIGYGQGVRKENCFQEMLAGKDIRFRKILARLSSDKNYRVFILTNFSKTHAIYASGFKKKDRGPNTLPAEFSKLGVTEEEFEECVKLYSKSKDFSTKISWDFPETVRKLGFSEKELTKLIGVIEYLYKCGIHKMDTLFGEVIEKLTEDGLLDESLVIFTADHGETLYRDNTYFKFTHGLQLAPEVLTVPFIVRAPCLGIKAQKHSFVSRSIDVFPTVAGLCGLRIPEEKMPSGFDFSSVITDQAAPPSLPAFSHTVLVSGHDSETYKGALIYKLYPRKDPDLMWVSVRIGDTVYKLAGSDIIGQDLIPSAYDLENDPFERTNLFDADNEYHQEILDKLKQYKKDLVSACRSKYAIPTSEHDIPENERLRRLRTMGYL
jgi:hypothetical protein